MHGMWAANMVNFRENCSKLDYVCLIDVAMYYNLVGGLEHFFMFPNIFGISSSQLTNSIIFSGG